ncbi:MAG: flagellar filament capping protein FliD [Thermoleophilaceae bacterium]
MIGVGLTGLASGLDTEAIIASLIAVERQPRVRLQVREDQVEARQSALRDISSRLKNLSSAVADLRSISVWADTQTVETNDATKMTARRISGAGPGGYQVDVTQLARAEQRTFAYTASGSASTIDIDGVIVDVAADATLDDVVAAINSKAESPVYAVNVSGQLVMSSKEAGAANGFTATSSTIVEDAGKAKAGLDAQFSVDGGAVQTSSSNVVTTAIPGVELTFKAVTGTPMAVTVGEPGPDKAKVKEKVEAFVEQYNSTIDLIRAKLEEERDPAGDPLKGVLRNDSMLSGLLSTLRQGLTEAFTGNPADLDELAEIGISTGAATGDSATSADSLAGKLVLDSAKLDAALESNLLDVRRMLGGISGTDGFAQRFEGIIDPVTQTGGTLDSRIDSADSELDRIRDSMDRLDLRLEAREARLRAQFATLERLLSQSQAQGQWLSGQIASLPDLNSN